MSPGDPDPDDRALIAALRQHGHRVTVQRLVLYRHLRAAADHPTADELAQKATADLPGLSTPTVYAALELLCALGLARRVDVGSPIRFEIAGPPHQHRRCSLCGRIDDITLEIPWSQVEIAANPDGFAAHAVNVLVAGHCATCRAHRPTHAHGA